jgi:hypothetical protein
MSKLKLSDIYCHVRQPRYPKNFWKLNQELSNIEPFSTFKKTRDSASIMLAIFMVYDPKSQLVNSGLSLEDMKKDIAVNFLEKPKFVWSDYSEIINAYNDISKTKIEKELDSWYEQLQERKEYLDTLDWNEDPDLKEGMLLDTDKHFEKYQNIVSALKEERQERLMKGGYLPSLLELWALEHEE